MRNSTLPRKISIKESDLPFACPPPDAPKWNMHPRVFIQISRTHPQQSCPYCGTRYLLVCTDTSGSS